MKFEPDPQVRTRDYAIGCIGAGMIMAECHLAAYAEAGFKVAAIASRTKAKAEAIASRWNIGTVHDTPETLIGDPSVEIVDIAYPPDLQPDLIRKALAAPNVKAILAQKPLALSLEEARKLRDEAAAAGKILSVNQNMRYDQSMRVLKQIIDGGELGEIVFAQIDMHAIPHWQGFLQGYDRLTLSNMSVHHLDALRFLFGDPAEVTSLTRQDPRTTFEHSDGIVVSTLRFPSGVRRGFAGGCLVRPRARTATKMTSTSTGASRERRAWPRARLAGRQARHRRSPTPRRRRPAANGCRPNGKPCGSRRPLSG
jgi:predicted dehydrogenase